MADEAKAISLGHKKWIMEFMKALPEGKCIYEDLVQEGEKHHCDTLGAMLKLLKRDKVLGYKPMFLMPSPRVARAAATHETTAPQVPHEQGRGGHAAEQGLRARVGAGRRRGG
jgi:hypothetical protein